MQKPYEMRFMNFEIRAEETEQQMGRLTGRPVVYGSRADIGPYDEIIEPGALDHADLRDVRLLVNHNAMMIPLARSRNNNENSTMQLILVPEGMDFRSDIDIKRNTDAMNLYSAVDRGDISGMSFRFAVDEDSWEGLETDHPTRHIRSISRIVEISAVTFPAYAATSIEARGISDALESAREALESAKAAARSIERQKQKIKIMMEMEDTPNEKH